MVEWQLPKLLTRVRFPPGAPTSKKGGSIGLLFIFFLVFSLRVDAVFHLVHPLVRATVDIVVALVFVRMVDGRAIGDGEFHERPIGRIVVVLDEPIHEAKAFLDLVGPLILEDDDEFITADTVDIIINEGLADDLRDLAKHDVA